MPATAPRPLKLACLLAALAMLCALAAVSPGAAGARRPACRANAAQPRHPRMTRSGRRRRAARCSPRRSQVAATPPAAAPAPTPTPEQGSKPAPEPEETAPPAPEAEPEAEPAESAEPAPAAAASSSIYWGAWIRNSAGEAPWSMTAASKFEQAAGKRVSLINWSSPFYLSACGGYCTFQTSQFDAVRSHGSIPFFSWNPGPGGGTFTDAKIAAGAQDAYITAWARAAKSWGHPFFLRFAWEMNAPWFPWGVGNNGTTAADFVAMWHHVHDIFTSVGATNATWVWCPNVDPYGKRTPLGSVYPGPAYVDWTCLDGYNGDNPWNSFSGLFRTSYEKITGLLATHKPMIVGETASTESGGSKAQWIAEMLKAVPAEFPKIHGLQWFDKTEAGPGGHSDWPIESSATATNAFATGMHAANYVENNYGNIATSPIPPP